MQINGNIMLMIAQSRPIELSVEFRQQSMAPPIGASIHTTEKF